MKKFLMAIALCLVCAASFTSCEPNEVDVNDCVVYVTPTGKKYHSSKKCAGKNAYAIKRSEIGNRQPCKKCM